MTTRKTSKFSQALSREIRSPSYEDLTEGLREHVSHVAENLKMDFRRGSAFVGEEGSVSGSTDTELYAEYAEPIEKALTQSERLANEPNPVDAIYRSYAERTKAQAWLYLYGAHRAAVKGELFRAITDLTSAHQTAAFVSELLDAATMSPRTPAGMAMAERIRGQVKTAKDEEGAEPLPESNLLPEQRFRGRSLPLSQTEREPNLQLWGATRSGPSPLVSAMDDLGAFFAHRSDLQLPSQASWMDVGTSWTFALGPTEARPVPVTKGSHSSHDIITDLRPTLMGEPDFADRLHQYVRTLKQDGRLFIRLVDPTQLPNIIGADGSTKSVLDWLSGNDQLEVRVHQNIDVLELTKRKTTKTEPAISNLNPVKIQRDGRTDTFKEYPRTWIREPTPFRKKIPLGNPDIDAAPNTVAREWDSAFTQAFAQLKEKLAGADSEMKRGLGEPGVVYRNARRALEMSKQLANGPVPPGMDSVEALWGAHEWRTAAHGWLEIANQSRRARKGDTSAVLDTLNGRADWTPRLQELREGGEAAAQKTPTLEEKTTADFLRRHMAAYGEGKKSVRDWKGLFPDFVTAFDIAPEQLEEMVTSAMSARRTGVTPLPGGSRGTRARNFHHYVQALSKEFAQTVLELGPDDRILHVGTGSGTFDATFYESGGRAAIDAVDLAPMHPVNAAELRSRPHEFFLGNIVDVALPEGRKYKVAIDRYSAISYDSNLSAVLRRVFSLLETQGVFYVTVEDSDAHSVNQIVLPDGRSVSILEWLRSIDGLEVLEIGEPKLVEYKDRPASLRNLRITKTKDEVEFPSVTIMGLQPYTPPIRVFREDEADSSVQGGSDKT